MSGRMCRVDGPGLPPRPTRRCSREWEEGASKLVESARRVEHHRCSPRRRPATRIKHSVSAESVATTGPRDGPLMRYRVELDELMAFVGQAGGLREARRSHRRSASTVRSPISTQAGRRRRDGLTGLGTTSGSLPRRQMREAVKELREAARMRTRNYTDAARLNVEMLSRQSRTWIPRPSTASARGCSNWPATWRDAFQVNVTMLGETGAMAGSDDAGTAWAARHMTRASVKCSAPVERPDVGVGELRRRHHPSRVQPRGRRAQCDARSGRAAGETTRAGQRRRCAVRTAVGSAAPAKV